jgi:hypothetical protein
MAGISLRCHCGRIRGVARAVSPSGGFRFVCYCKDCQAFARFLERSNILDAAGGTDIFQMPPGHVTFSAGFEALRCLRVSGKVLRWYADCCHTPIANTAAHPRFPIVALIHSIMDCAADGRSRDALLGPPLCRIYEQRSGRFCRTQRRRHRFAFLPAVQRRFWAGGCADWPSRTRSSMIARKLRVPCRNCSHPGRIGDEHCAPIHLSAADDR